LILVASLLAFPNAVPWLVAAWLLAYTLLVLFGRKGHICLGACAAVLVAKRLTPAPGLLALVAVILEIPRAHMSDPYWGLEREIARQEDVELIPDTAMRTIFLRSPTFPPGSWRGEPYLTDETGIHANARGSQILAESVAEALQRMYGPRIRKN
jgi:hypothetical protein